MIKYDFQKPSKIPLLECQGMPTALYLKKRRFQCKECRKVQVSETPIVKKNHQISTDIQRKITQLLVEKDSMKSIAERLHISTSIVLRRLKLVKTKPNLKSLPKIMSWRVRIQIMNQFDKQSKEYRRLKRYSHLTFKQYDTASVIDFPSLRYSATSFFKLAQLFSMGFNSGE